MRMLDVGGLREYQTAREIENVVHCAKKIPLVNFQKGWRMMSALLKALLCLIRSCYPKGEPYTMLLSADLSRTEVKGRGDLEADLCRWVMLPISLSEMHMQVSSRKQIVCKNVSAVSMLGVDMCTDEEGVLPKHRI